MFNELKHWTIENSYSSFQKIIYKAFINNLHVRYDNNAGYTIHEWTLINININLIRTHNLNKKCVQSYHQRSPVAFKNSDYFHLCINWIFLMNITVESFQLQEICKEL